MITALVIFATGATFAAIYADRLAHGDWMWNRPEPGSNDAGKERPAMR